MRLKAWWQTTTSTKWKKIFSWWRKIWDGRFGGVGEYSRAMFWTCNIGDTESEVMKQWGLEVQTACQHTVMLTSWQSPETALSCPHSIYPAVHGHAEVKGRPAYSSHLKGNKRSQAWDTVDTDVHREIQVIMAPQKHFKQNSVHQSTHYTQFSGSFGVF